MIDILLATYNGEKYLHEQLSSILAQTYTDWRIIARDDGSSDSTPEILEHFAEEHAGRLMILHDEDENLGCIQNFSRLLSYSDADYSMFCDQDDFWLPDKIEITLKKMKELEKHGEPVLVHTDLRVVDSEKNTLAESFVRLHKLNALPESRAGLMFKNSVTGCTVMINRRLRELAGELPESCTMHDHYLAEIALALGRLGFVDRAIILYRQHSGNVCGSHKKSVVQKIKRILSISGWRSALQRTHAEAEKNLAQARCVYARFRHSMDAKTREMYELALNMEQYPKYKRLCMLKKSGMLPLSAYEKKALEIYCLSMKHEQNRQG